MVPMHEVIPELKVNSFVSNCQQNIVLGKLDEEPVWQAGEFIAS